MSEALCQCGHPKHSDGPLGLPCDHALVPMPGPNQFCKCTKYEPADPPPTREPIRLTAEAEAAWQEWLDPSKRRIAKDQLGFLREMFFAGFRAARLAGGPTLADAWDECCKAFAWAMKEGPTLAPVSWLSYVHNNNPHRTPESEDTDV